MRNILYLLDGIIHLQEDKEQSTFLLKYLYLIKGDQPSRFVPDCPDFKTESPLTRETFSLEETGMVGHPRMTQTTFTS